MRARDLECWPVLTGTEQHNLSSSPNNDKTVSSSSSFPPFEDDQLVPYYSIVHSHVLWDQIPGYSESTVWTWISAYPVANLCLGLPIGATFINFFQHVLSLGERLVVLGYFVQFWLCSTSRCRQRTTFQDAQIDPIRLCEWFCSCLQLLILLVRILRLTFNCPDTDSESLGTWSMAEVTISTKVQVLRGSPQILIEKLKGCTPILRLYCIPVSYTHSPTSFQVYLADRECHNPLRFSASPCICTLPQLIIRCQCIAQVPDPAVYTLAFKLRDISTFSITKVLSLSALPFSSRNQVSWLWSTPRGRFWSSPKGNVILNIWIRISSTGCYQGCSSTPSWERKTVYCPRISIQ